LLTVRLNWFGGSNSKVAVTVVFCVIVTVHVLVPEQPPPLQPVKMAFALATAVRVTGVPSS
jgi:hypothetical protein